MSYINWGLAGGNNALASFGQGMQLGNYIRERQDQKEYKSALATVFGPKQPEMQSPDYEAGGVQGGETVRNRPEPSGGADAAWGVIAQHNPQLAAQHQRQQAEQRAQQQEADLTRRAMAGDPEALNQLATVNFDRWNTLSTDQRKAIEEENKMYGNAAMDVLNLPPAQRSQAIMGYANRFNSPEIAAIADLPPQEQEAALRAAVAEAQMTEKLIAMERPDYMAVEGTADLVNVRDPQAVAQVAAARQGRAAPQPIPKQVGDATYYQNPETGEWFDNPQEAMGGGAGNSAGGF